MKIAIVTLPLHVNYGGILQAYALKSVLEDMGHEAEVLDRKIKISLPPSWKMPFIYAGRMVQNIVSFGKGPEVFREKRLIRELPVIASEVSKFTDTYVNPRVLEKYGDIGIGEYDAFIAGSDQVWRPKYFGKIEDAFLAFTAGWNVRRIAYAASFGTDQLEYTYEQLEACSRLLGRFDAVSVREDSAVTICDEWLDCDKAVHVLDPVMLLGAESYGKIASGAARRPAEGKALVYLLDRTKEKDAVVARASKWVSGGVHDISVAPTDGNVPLKDRVAPPLEEWLACFEDAGFVITDSFHGCVIALLFHKPFIILGNVGRGLTRINSLLELFSLDDRYVHGLDPDDDGEYYLSGIDWESVDCKLDRMRKTSMEFLRKSLK